MENKECVWVEGEFVSYYFYYEKKEKTIFFHNKNFKNYIRCLIIIGMVLVLVIFFFNLNVANAMPVNDKINDEINLKKQLIQALNELKDSLESLKIEPNLVSPKFGEKGSGVELFLPRSVKEKINQELIKSRTSKLKRHSLKNNYQKITDLFDQIKIIKLKPEGSFPILPVIPIVPMVPIIPIINYEDD
jgi:hypothetical protein